FDAWRDAAHVTRLARGDGRAVRDPVEVRADVQAGVDAAARAQAPAGRRGRSVDPGRAQRRAPAAVIAATPALPLDDAGPYVAAAYLVFLALILIYVAII